MTMRPGTTAETSDDGRVTLLVERTLGKPFASLAATPRRYSREPVASQPDADVLRVPPMVGAARCPCSSLVAAPEIEIAGTRPAAASCDALLNSEVPR